MQYSKKVFNNLFKELLEKSFQDINKKDDNGNTVLVRPEKASMFSRSKSYQDKSRSPVARVAMWRETKMLKPTDNVIVG